MSFGEVAIVAGSLLVLFFAGWAFLCRSSFRDFDDQDYLGQVPLALGGIVEQSVIYKLFTI